LTRVLICIIGERSSGPHKAAVVKKLTVLTIRALLGAVFAVMLTRFFFPGATLTTMIGVGLVLVFLAYVFDSLHGGRKDG
jgi:hypothetical protein